MRPAVTEGNLILSRARRADGRGRRVLVVEDEALICLDTADALEQQGFRVQTARSGEEALRDLRGGLAVDILFTDINLAGAMDGAALARLARDLLPRLAVAYTSGSVRALADGVEGSIFISKPYNPERVGFLLSRLNTVDA